LETHTDGGTRGLCAFHGKESIDLY